MSDNIFSLSLMLGIVTNKYKFQNWYTSLYFSIYVGLLNLLTEVKNYIIMNYINALAIILPNAVIDSLVFFWFNLYQFFH